MKVPRYIHQFQSQGLALRNQPKPQLYFHSPLRGYLNTAFQNGFVLDGFDERAFPRNTHKLPRLAGVAVSQKFPPR